MDNSLQYKVFDWLRFPLIIGVVFIHSFGEPFDINSLDFHHLDGEVFFNLFRVSISHVLTHVCVPVFFLISGNLFFRGLKKWKYSVFLQKIRRRCKSLLLPYIIWNSISILFYLFLVYRKGGFDDVWGFFEERSILKLYWNYEILNVDRLNWLGGSRLDTAPFCTPLWFLRDLMVVCVFSPFLWYLFKYTKLVGVLILVLCYLSGVFFNISGFSIDAFLFWGVGGYLSICSKDVTQITHKFRWLLYVVTFVLWIICTLFDGHNTPIGDYIYPFYVLMGTITTVNLSSYIVNKEILPIPQFLTKGSFFVFLSHMICLPYVEWIVSHCLQKDGVVSLYLSYLLIPIITVLVCLVVYWFLRRYLPNICGVLTGAR